MKILVTGGAGYIGSILVPKLLAAGNEVTVLDSLLYGQTSLMECCHDPRFSMVRGDARDERVVKELVSKADAILPLACMTGAPLCDRDPVAARTVNHDAVKMIASLASKQQRIVFPNTNSGYGVGDSGMHCTEDSPLKPVSLYGRLKVDAENFLMDRGGCVVFRFATVFGASPRMRLDLLVNDFTYRAVTDRFVVLFEPHFKRNYLHVRDAAGAFMHAIEKFETMKGRPYNVGLSEANLSKWELCEVIKKHVSDFHFMASEVGKDPDQRNYIVSNARIEATGYRTTTGLDAGIEELIKAFRILRRNQYANV